jgi:hypothetical protein
MVAPEQAGARHGREGRGDRPGGEIRATEAVIQSSFTPLVGGVGRKGEG